MEPNLPSQLPTPVKSKLPLPLILIGIILFLTASSLTFYYFSQRKTGSLPPQVKESGQPKTTVSCPLPPEFCQGKDFIKEGSFSATLKEGTPLYAVFDGSFSVLTPSRQRPGEQGDLLLIRLVGGSPPLLASYFFKGKAIPNGQVRSGDLIATASGKLIDGPGGGSFFFQVQKPVEGNSPPPPNLPPPL